MAMTRSAIGISAPGDAKELHLFELLAVAGNDTPLRWLAARLLGSLLAFKRIRTANVVLLLRNKNLEIGLLIPVSTGLYDLRLEIQHEHAAIMLRMLWSWKASGGGRHALVSAAVAPTFLSLIVSVAAAPNCR